MDTRNRWRLASWYEDKCQNNCDLSINLFAFMTSCFSFYQSYKLFFINQEWLKERVNSYYSYERFNHYNELVINCNIYIQQFDFMLDFDGYA